jgi:hypothetical protein
MRLDRLGRTVIAVCRGPVSGAAIILLRPDVYLIHAKPNYFTSLVLLDLRLSDHVSVDSFVWC